MKCDACGNEVALAKVCPYCGHRVNVTRTKNRRDRGRPSGSFRGRVDEGGAERTHTPAGGPVAQILRFFLEPRIAAWQKGLAILALFYVVSPLDLLPGAALPLLGWMDDLAVATFAWRWIISSLSAIDRKS